MKLRAAKEACKYMRLEARALRLVSGLGIKSIVSSGSIELSVDYLPFRNGRRYRHSRKQLIVHHHVGNGELVFKKKGIGELGRSL